MLYLTLYGTILSSDIYHHFQPSPMVRARGCTAWRLIALSAITDRLQTCLTAWGALEISLDAAVPHAFYRRVTFSSTGCERDAFTQAGEVCQKRMRETDA